MNTRRHLPSANLKADDLSDLKVLVVDDHTNTVRLIVDVLRAAGIGAVFSAAEGLSARQVLAREEPDVVFTDWRMPLMDGLELTRSIRAAAVARDRSVPNPAIPVIMVTGHRSAAEVEVAREAGVNEFVMKPFTPAALLSRLQAVLTQPRSFIVSANYLGPDRRRKAEISYAGPLRRTSDPDEVVDVVERQAARETISVELEAMRRLIAARGGVDRATLQMTYRVMQHTRFRARQVRDRMLERATDDLLAYAAEVGGMEHCESDIVEAHLSVLGQILEGDDHDAVGAAKQVRGLEALIRRKRAARQILAA
ncbi:response regulator [Phenylobacterium sp.]|uniref:response regulator n=1 Tax=Phenylobacterium sp. TaxID=1871053 RepID=UPI002730A2A2|nr:response regulator [Phenylobacterium sp.]MDP1873217.1 response regulator [Phenylobacterium sp.]MDP3490584.1 response regulator [Phenylobacterium sp.]